MTIQTWLSLAEAPGPCTSYGELIHRFWPVAAVSFGLALLATPVCRSIAIKCGIVDKPDAHLKPHQKPIPYLGGVAIFLGWAGGIGAALFFGENNGTEDAQARFPLMVGIALAGLATMLIGLFDDLRVMPARAKLLANIAVALALLWMGLGDQLIQVVTDIMGVRFEPHERWLQLCYSVPIMLLIVVGACNATNLIDGLDGLCTGVLGIISIGFLLLATHLRAYEASPAGNERIILALAMLGAAVGFLPFNLNPAKIFMGDAGSMLLGLNAAIILLLFAEEHMIRWMMGALMVFGLPIGDMLLTLARRWRNGRPLMQGDRSHFYDQLVDRGLTVKQVVVISYLLTTAFVAVGTSVIFLRLRYAVLVYFVAFLATVAGIWKFDMAGIEEKRSPGENRDGPESDRAGV